MIVSMLLLVGLLGLWVMRRRARQGVLAGRDADRPTYTVSPPGRRVGRLKDSRL